MVWLAASPRSLCELKVQPIHLCCACAAKLPPTPRVLQNCNWEEHPAEYILSQTKSGKYLVMRRGLTFLDYGLVSGALGTALVLPAGMDGPASCCLSSCPCAAA